MKRLFRNATLINEGRSFTASLLTSGTQIEKIYEGTDSFPEQLLSEVDELVPVSMTKSTSVNQGSPTRRPSRARVRRR